MENRYAICRFVFETHVNNSLYVFNLNSFSCICSGSRHYCGNPFLPNAHKYNGAYNMSYDKFEFLLTRVTNKNKNQKKRYTKG